MIMIDYRTDSEVCSNYEELKQVTGIFKQTTGMIMKRLNNIFTRPILEKKILPFLSDSKVTELVSMVLAGSKMTHPAQITIL